MALYLAQRIEEGYLDYKAIFSKQVYQPLQADVDAILVADGHQDKIVAVG